MTEGCHDCGTLRRSQFDPLIGLDIADGEFDAPAGLSSWVAEGRALSVDSALQGGEALRVEALPRCAKPRSTDGKSETSVWFQFL